MNLGVVNLGFLNENSVIREYCLAFIYDIELLSLENIDKLRYSFLFKKKISGAPMVRALRKKINVDRVLVYV